MYYWMIRILVGSQWWLTDLPSLNTESKPIETLQFNGMEIGIAKS